MAQNNTTGGTSNKYPPKFDNTLVYPAEYHLDQLDTFVTSNPGTYFNIAKLPEVLTYGKHYFTVSFNDPQNAQYFLKDRTRVLFEFKDANGTIIFSDTTTYNALSGAAIGYVWVKKDPLRTYNHIKDGWGTLTIVGELDGVPNSYKDKFNIKETIPIEIRTSFPNTSPILFQSSSLLRDNITIAETLESDIDNANFNRSYADISMSHLETFGGKIDRVLVSVLESGSLSGMTEEEFTDLTTYMLINESGSHYEPGIISESADGLNPTSKTFRVLMPPMPNQSGSDFGLADNRFKFKFRFFNPANQPASDIRTSTEETEIFFTSSWIDFAGPATVITGEDNLIAGQMYLGNLVGTGMEFNAASSAFIRSIGYLGFTSASAGSGSGFLLYSGSVLGGNTDDYSGGGVGFEFVSSSEAFFKFNTNPGEFEVRAKKFFVGSETTQFISGSGDKIEISSSNFHLKPDGTVKMIGEIEASSGGTIGGAEIGDDSLSFPPIWEISASTNVYDPASFISSSNFKVSAGGQMTASKAFFEDVVITGSTTEMDIGTLKVGSKRVAGDSDDASFNNITASGNFTASGYISASGAYFGNDVVVDGNVTANMFKTQTITSDFSSGSTIFGDTFDDVHQLTGSLRISGSGPHYIETGSFGIHTRFPSAALHVSAAAPHTEHAIVVEGQVGIGPSAHSSSFALDIDPKQNSDGIRIRHESNYSEPPSSSIELTSVNHSGRLELFESMSSAIRFDGTAGSYISGSNTKLGIGNISPPHELTVEGDISASGNIYATQITASSGILADSFQSVTGGSTISFNDDLNLTGNLETSGYISASGTITGLSGSLRNLRIFDGDQTLNPRLSVGRSFNQNISFDITDRVGSIYHKQDESTGTHTLEIGNHTPTSQSNIHFVHGWQDGSNQSTLMYITSSGNVGIGTTSPIHTLDLKGSGAGNTMIGFYQNDGDYFGSIGSGGSVITGGNANDLGISARLTGGNLLLGANGTTEIMRLSSDGNVGIKTTTPSSALDIQGITTIRGNLKTPDFVSGFAGSGFQITSQSDSGKTLITVDDLTVRGTMSIYELLISQVRATNGSLFVSNTSKIVSASLTSTSDTYNLYFDTGSGYGHTFRVGDLIRAQRWTPTNNGSGSTDGHASYNSELQITSITSVSGAVAVLTGSDAPQPGYEYVRIGHLNDSSRQGSIYMTADDTYAPFIDVVDGVGSHAQWNSTGKVKTRMGRLDGISTSVFPNVSGYGFYASGSAYLEGAVNATSGLIGGWGISSNRISSSNIYLESDTQRIYIKNATFGSTGIQLGYNNGNPHFHAGASSSAGEYIEFDGTNLAISGSNFALTKGGNITATNADLSGKVTATSGEIGGFSIENGVLTGSDFFISGAATGHEVFISSSNFVVTADGKLTASDAQISGDINIVGYALSSDVSSSFAEQGEISGAFAETSSSIANTIMTDVSGAIVNVPPAPAGEGLFLSYPHMGYYSGSGWMSYISASGGFLFKQDANNLISFGDDSDAGSSNFVIKATNTYLSGSSVQVLTDKFFLGSEGSQYISGSNGNLKIESENFKVAPEGHVTASSALISGSVTIAGDIEINSLPAVPNNQFLKIHYDFNQGTINTRTERVFNKAGIQGEWFTGSYQNTSFLQVSSGSDALSQYGLEFSGSIHTGRIVMSDTAYSSDVGGLYNWSVSYWFKPRKVDSNHVQLIYKQGGSSAGINTFITESKIYSNFYEGGDSAPKHTVTSASIENDTWYHLVATLENNVSKLYLNGELKDTMTIGNMHQLGAHSGLLTIGSLSGDNLYVVTSGSTPALITGASSSFDGFLDEFRIYRNYALTEGNVRGLYLNPTGMGGTNIAGDQITTGKLKSNSWIDSGSQGSRFDLDEGTFILGGDTNPTLKFDGSNLKLSGSSVDLFVSSFVFGDKDTSFISSSDSKVEISASKYHLKTDGTQTGSNVLFDGGTIAGWTINDESIFTGSLILSSSAETLVVKDPLNSKRTAIEIGNTELEHVSGSSTNMIQDTSLEFSESAYYTASNYNTMTGTHELWNSGSITMSFTDDNPKTGTFSFRINCQAEQGVSDLVDQEEGTVT